MQRLASFLLLLVTGFSSCSQSTPKQAEDILSAQKEIKVGGNCEGCEAIYESPVAFEQLNEVDTLPDFMEPGPKIEINGIVYQPDGKTPAPGIILYIYHTDQKGIYATKGNEKGWAKRHGYIRGWIKTDKNGFYRFYTLRPAAYPDRRTQQHIHITVKEPGKSAYWIDTYQFDDDPLLPEGEKTRPFPKGGSGVLKTATKDGMLRATRNIILGFNIADYPKQ